MARTPKRHDGVVRWAVFWARRDESQHPIWKNPKLRRKDRVYKTLAEAVADLLQTGASLHVEGGFDYFFAPFLMDPIEDICDFTQRSHVTLSSPLMPWAKAHKWLEAGRFMRHDSPVVATVNFVALKQLLAS